MIASRPGLLNPGRKSKARCSLYRMKVELTAGLDNSGKREISFPWRAAKTYYSVVRPVEQLLYRANPVPTLRFCIFQKCETFYSGKVWQFQRKSFTCLYTSFQARSYPWEATIKIGPSFHLHTRNNWRKNLTLEGPCIIFCNIYTFQRDTQCSSTDSLLMLRCQLYMFRTVTVHPQELLFRCCMCRLWYVVRNALSDMSRW